MPGMAPPTPMQANGVVNGSASVNGMQGPLNGTLGADVNINGVGGRRPALGPGQGPGQGAGPGLGQGGLGLLSARLGESMDVIRAEYDGLVSELGAVRGARDEWEGKGVYSSFSICFFALFSEEK